MDPGTQHPVGGHKCATCSRMIPAQVSCCPQCLTAPAFPGGKIAVPTRTAGDRLRMAVVSPSKGPPGAPARPLWTPPWYWWLGVFAKELLSYYIYPVVVALWAVLCLFTDVLLTWPYWASGAVAFAFVGGVGWALTLVKRKNTRHYGVFKVLVGCGLGVWALTEGRVEQGRPPVIALWISLLLAVDFVVDGFEQALSKKEGEKPAPQAAK